MNRVAAFALVCALLLAATAVRANVMGIDFGTEFIKIASPHGNATIDIVLNEQARRKSNNFVGFRGADRYFGEDARNLAARFPDNMFTGFNRLAGALYDSPTVRETFAEQRHTFAVVPSPDAQRGTAALRVSGNPETIYTVEELLGMMFGYFKEMTQKDARISASDAVVTVPAFFSMAQRQALVDAAALADVRVLGMLHSTTAVALDFGMRRRGFGNDTVTVVILDVGTSKAEAGVYTYSPPPTPKGGARVKLAESFGTLTTRFIATDESLGGRTFDTCIAQMLEDEIVAKLKIPRIFGGTTAQQHKAQFALMRAANGIRERLSANSVAPVTVEGVAPDRDYSTSVTRQQFEDGCAPLFERVVALARRAFEGAGVTPADVASFEMMGGAMRSPKIIADLSAFYGKPVDRTINSDEAAAFGAAYYGARLSGYFRVRSFAISDALLSGAFYATLSATDAVPAPEPRLLFDRAVVGARRSITVNRTADFNVTIHSSTDDGATLVPLATVRVTGVEAALRSLAFFEPAIPHANHTHILRLEFRINENGILVVDDADVAVRYAANVSKRVKVADPAAEPAAAAATDGEGDAPAADDAPKAAPVFETVHEIVMKRKTAAVKAAVALVSPPALSAEDIAASRAVLAALDKADRVKRETSAAKNNLETLIQSTKSDGVLDNEQLRSLGFLPDDEAEAIRAVASELQEWLEDGEGSEDACTKEQYDAKLAVLQKAIDAPLARLAEHRAKLEPKPKKAATGGAKAKDKKKKSKKPERAAKPEADASAAPEDAEDDAPVPERPETDNVDTGDEL